MLFYACVSSWILVRSTNTAANNLIFDPNVSLNLSYYVVTSYILVVCLSLMLTGFLAFHIWLIVKQYTTIEFCEKRKK